MTENQKNNQFVDSFENLIENSLDNAFDKYDYADQMALMDIWYEQHYLDDWDDDYSITEEYYCYDTEFDEENSESTQNESKYEIRTDNFEEFIQKLTNEE